MPLTMLSRRNRFGETEFSGVVAFLNLFVRKRPCVFCGLSTSRATTGGHSHFSCAHEFNKALARDAKGYPLRDSNGEYVMQKKLVRCAQCGRVCVEGQGNKAGESLCDDCDAKGREAVGDLESMLESLHSAGPEGRAEADGRPLPPGVSSVDETKFLLDPRTATPEDYKKLVDYLKNGEPSDERQ
jgi:hypothetical protein